MYIIDMVNGFKATFDKEEQVIECVLVNGSDILGIYYVDFTKMVVCKVKLVVIGYSLSLEKEISAPSVDWELCK